MPIFLISIYLLSALVLPSSDQPTFLLQLKNSTYQQVIWERPMTTEDRFSLVHRNSIYGAVVRETFRIDEEGALWLTAIQTDSPAVLEYYGLEESGTGPIRYVRKIDSMKIVITLSGEFWLDFAGENFSLSHGVPDGTLIEIGTKKSK